MASRSWPLSAKHRLREYDSCCLRGMGGGGAAGGTGPALLSQEICREKRIPGGI